MLLLDCTTPEKCRKLSDQQFAALDMASSDPHARTLQLVLSTTNADAIAERVEELGHHDDAREIRRRKSDALEKHKNVSRYAYKLWCRNNGHHGA